MSVYYGGIAKAAGLPLALRMPDPYFCISVPRRWRSFIILPIHVNAAATACPESYRGGGHRGRKTST